MLENDWYICRVKSGKGRGKFLGFPTLNLSIPKKFSTEYGIFAGLVSWQGETYYGAFHYGPIDTFNDPTVSLEVFVLDAKIDSPPIEIKIKLVQFLRMPKKFANSQELIQQITIDVAQTKQILDLMSSPLS